MVFVNSERYAWLPQSIYLPDNKYYLKPDGFATHRGMYIKKNKEATQRSGVPETKLFDCIILFESKLNITGADSFGQVVRYLSRIGDGTSISYSL